MLTVVLFFTFATFVVGTTVLAFLPLDWRTRQEDDSETVPWR